MKIIDFYMQEQ